MSHDYPACAIFRGGKCTCDQEAPPHHRERDAFDAAVVPPDPDKSVLQQRIAELVAQHGGVRPAARVLEVDHGYVYRLLSGEKNDPGDKLLRKLKLRRVVTYERTDVPRVLEGLK